MAVGEHARARLRFGTPRWTDRVPAEMAGYALIAVVLAVLLWTHVRDVDSFYLDEWFYVHGAEYIWQNFPAGLIEAIPEWNRGPQRLYSSVLAPVWGLFEPSTAYDLAHALNVALLVSAVVPAALLARRVIDPPLLRVLAVALAVAVPWLMIGSHLLTENLAFPLYLWAMCGIVRAAENPSPGTQAWTLGALAALAFCRLNLAFVVLVLFAAVLAAEVLRRRAEPSEPLGPWLRAALRREALVVVAAVIVVVVGTVAALRGVSGLGAYGTLDFGSSIERLFGAGAAETRRTALTYIRSILVGGFVFPVVLGLGVALAGVAGRAGRRLFMPSLVGLGGFVVVVVAVSVYTAGAPLEERYVFYVYGPIAILAVAGLDQAWRLRWWIAGAGGVALWALIAGATRASFDAGHFFIAPAGAFWNRIVEHRLRGWEQDLFGWMFINPTGWLLIAVGLCVMLWFIGRTRDRPRVTAGVLAAGLTFCVVAQALVLDYGFKQELNGTPERPGGIALSADRQADRETWLDDHLPSGEWATVVPGVPTPGAPWAGTERLQFWNRSIDASVRQLWNEAAAPRPPGYATNSATIGPDGLARWMPPRWFAAHQDDPRVQFAGRLVARSPVSRFALYRATPSHRAMWTSVGLEADGAVLRGRPVTMTLDRRGAGDPRVLVIELQAPVGASAVRWEFMQGGRPVDAGRLRGGGGHTMRVPVPPCTGGSVCDPVAWTLRATGRSIGLPLPQFGAPGPPRPVVLMVPSVRIG